MRIHIQNPPDDPHFRIPPAMWHAATARAGDCGLGHQVSFGDTEADFAEAVAEAEALIGDKDVIRAFMPRAAPRLRLRSSPTPVWITWPRSTGCRLALRCSITAGRISPRRASSG